MRRSLNFVAGLVIVALGGGSACATTPVQQPPRQPSASVLAATTAPAPSLAPTDRATPDFDGDGKADFASQYVDTTEHRVASIWYGSGSKVDITAAGLSTDSTNLQPGMLARDFDADGYTDLALVAGDYGDQLRHLVIVPGSASGLRIDQRHTLTLPRSGDCMEPSDCPKVPSLALVEAPVRRLALTVRTDDKPGEVLLYDLDADGIPAGRPISLVPGQGKVPKLTEQGTFGKALATAGDQLFVGVPDADVSGVKYAGAVTVVTLGRSAVTKVSLITQSTSGVAGTVGKSDEFGYSLAAGSGYLVVGTPRDDVGSIRSTGSVQVFTLRSGKVTPKVRLHQATKGVPGKLEVHDLFGWSVALVSSCRGTPAVAVGGIGELIPPHRSGDGSGDGSAWLIPLRSMPGCSASQIYECHGLSGQPHYRYVGWFVGGLRDRGAVDDDLVIVGAGSFSEGPIGMLYRWSAKTRTSVLAAPDIYESLAAR